MPNQESDRQQRHAQFVRVMDELPLSQGGLAKWMLLKDTKQNRESISRKYRNAVGVTPKDLALLSLLKLLHDDGYDLNSVTFSELGDITCLTKR